MTEIADEFRRSILRKEFYMDVLNCDPMSFDKKCELTLVCPSFAGGAPIKEQKGKTALPFLARYNSTSLHSFFVI